MATDDLLTDGEARRYLGVGVNDSKHTQLLAGWITSASRALAVGAGTIVCGTVTGELHHGGKHSIWLRHAPVYSVIQVVEYDYTTAGTLTAESNTSKPAAGYRVNAKSGQLTRRNANVSYPFEVGDDNVYVTYVAGRYTTTVTVDQRFKDACGLILQNVWRSYEDQVGSSDEFDIPQAAYPRFVVPNAVKDLLGDEWQYGSGTGD